jgi:hypothetical protein
MVATLNSVVSNKVIAYLIFVISAHFNGVIHPVRMKWFLANALCFGAPAGSSVLPNGHRP